MKLLQSFQHPVKHLMGFPPLLFLDFNLLWKQRARIPIGAYTLSLCLKFISFSHIFRFPRMEQPDPSFRKYLSWPIKKDPKGTKKPNPMTGPKKTFMQGLSKHDLTRPMMKRKVSAKHSSSPSRHITDEDFFLLESFLSDLFSTVKAPSQVGLESFPKKKGEKVLDSRQIAAANSETSQVSQVSIFVLFNKENKYCCVVALRCFCSSTCDAKITRWRR